MGSERSSVRGLLDILEVKPRKVPPSLLSLGQMVAWKGYKADKYETEEGVWRQVYLQIPGVGRVMRYRLTDYTTEEKSELKILNEEMYKAWFNPQ